MAKTVQELMTSAPQTLEPQASVQEAARLMAEHDIGDVIITEGDTVQGIVTDRDIAVRVVAEGRDPSSTTLGEFCTQGVVTVSPTDHVEEALRLMRENAVRRLPVVESGSIVGVVSIGDFAGERDLDATMTDISAAPSNN